MRSYLSPRYKNRVFDTLLKKVELSELTIFREPLVHFFLIGLLIYLLYGVFAEPAAEETDKTIVVSAGEIEWMNASWQKRWNRPPTAEELDGLVQQYIKETVLYREALTMGLNQHDTVIRRRLAQKLEFLARDLVAMMPPAEEELQAYFNEHKSIYQEPARFTFTQVFIDPDNRGDATLADAEKIKAELIAQGDAIENAGALGDGLMLQSYYPEHDKAVIQRAFGSDFADSVIELSPGQLMFIAVVPALLELLRRLPVTLPQGAWRILPYAIGSIAAFWTIDRVMSYLPLAV
jgi:hypothetical protein